MIILGIETSCDETAAAVVRDGREVLSSVVHTQIALHAPYGGVVPEIASRSHVEKIEPVIRAAIEKAGCGIDAVAVTYGPGLLPALLVGLNAAKGLAKALGVPLFGINHLSAHLHSPFLFDAPSDAEASAPDPASLTPALGLVVSGGNTVWVEMQEYGRPRVIGETLDDAAGEAFDKAAKLLGLGYPGGLKIDRISSEWMASDAGRTPLIPFPQGRPRDGVAALAGLPAELCVSFSGLKTALSRYLQKNKDNLCLEHVVASYQEAIAQVLADRTHRALRRKSYRAFILGGGVSLNSRIRALLSATCAEAGVPLYMAKPAYTGDNGAMVAGLAYVPAARVADGFSLDANPSLEVGT